MAFQFNDFSQKAIQASIDILASESELPAPLELVLMQLCQELINRRESHAGMSVSEIKDMTEFVEPVSESPEILAQKGSQLRKLMGML